MKTITATPLQSREIARLIMVAMNYECCQYFAGDNHTLDEFEDMMTALVERTDSQYSHLNTLVALDGDDIAGICVSYDGGQLHQLRQAFIREALHRYIQVPACPQDQKRYYHQPPSPRQEINRGGRKGSSRRGSQGRCARGHH